MSELFEKKKQILKNVTEHVDNGRMPIISYAQTWAIAYAGGTAAECLKDCEREIELYGKHLKDMYFDGVFLFGLNRPLSIYQGLGFEPYFISSDGITLQCSAETKMIANDELDQFIASPKRYLIETGIARRYPNLRSGDAAALLANSLAAFMEFGERGNSRAEALKTVYETPYATDPYNLISSALDVYNLYRGFRDAYMDIRRRPKQVLDACEAINQHLLFPKASSYERTPWISSPIMAGHYLGPKLFKTFMWPSYKKLLCAYTERGAAIAICMEGKWGKESYELLNELPKGCLIAFVENDDFDEVQRTIGDKVSLGYPFPMALLKTGTPKQIKDTAKRIIDRIGTTGTFMALDKALLTKSDAKPENYAALSEVCHTYTTK